MSPEEYWNICGNLTISKKTDGNLLMFFKENIIAEGDTSIYLGKINVVIEQWDFVFVIERTSLYSMTNICHYQFWRDGECIFDISSNLISLPREYIIHKDFTDNRLFLFKFLFQ